MAHAKTMKTAPPPPPPPPSLEDVTCPICLSLLLEPVTLPCRHSLCLTCFQEHVNVTSLVCPMCRTRISVWVRKNSKTNTLVDAKLWKTIQKHFPAQLEARLTGHDDSGTLPEVKQKVCKPGEIRQEYESFLQQQTQEARVRKSKEESESIKLIQKLQEDEMKRQQELEQLEEKRYKDDFLLALKLEETDIAQVHTQQKKLQEICAQDEYLARQLEVAANQSPHMAIRNKGAGELTYSTPSAKGPMDAFLEQKGVRHQNHHQASSNVLSSSDTNTILSPGASPPPHSRGMSRKRLLSFGSDSENEEPSSRHVARGKENLRDFHPNSPSSSRGECSKGKHSGRSTVHRDLQFSPDIDSYCVSATPSPTTLPRNHATSSRAQRKKDSPSEDEGDEKVVVEGSEERHNSESSPADSPEKEISFLLKWEKDEESLKSLLAEQKRAEAQLKQELEDRILAQALQEELNSQTRQVLRTKGSENEYVLRRRSRTDVSRHEEEEAGPSKRHGTKRQATLSEVLCKRQKTHST